MTYLFEDLSFLRFINALDGEILDSLLLPAFVNGLRVLKKKKRVIVSYNTDQSFRKKPESGIKRKEVALRSICHDRWLRRCGTGSSC